MRKKWMFAVLAVIVLISALAIGFWDVLLIHYAPKIILSAALHDAFTLLQQRFENDPMVLALKTIHPEGKQTVTLELDAERPYLGDIYCNMELQLEPHAVWGEGFVQGEQLGLNLKIYADPEFIAVSSKELVSGQYYGITYDTFQQDIRSIPLLTWVIGESVLRTWNSDVLNIQQSMEKGYSVPQLWAPETNNLKNLLLFCISAPSETEKTSIVTDEFKVEGYKITYFLNDPQILPLLCEIMDIENKESADATVVFYVYERKLLAVEVHVSAEDIARHFRLELGLDTLRDPIVAVLSKKDGDAEEQRNVRIMTISYEPVFCEKWEFSSNAQEKISLEYEWDPVTGDMQLSINNAENIALNFSGTENGIRIESDDFSPLFRQALQWGTEQSMPASGIINICKGSTIETPEYKNLDQWSLEDFLILLEGIGGLLDLRFEW